MTTPRTTRTLRVLLALGLAATVALPAATALQFASAGNAAADAAWKQAASLGGGGAACTDYCTMQYTGLGSLSNEGYLGADVAWDVNAETHERETVDAALDAAEELRAKLRAELEAKVREARETRERARADIHYDYDAEARGGADAAWDTEAEGGAYLGMDGILTLGGERHIDLQQEKRLKAETEAKVKAEADSAVQMIADLLAELQGHVTMSVNAAFDAVADAGAAVGGALGLVQDTQVSVHQSLDADASLGSVPSVDIPKLSAPSADLGGSASVVAQATAAAQGVIHG